MEESYTSKASFLDGDEIPVYDPKRKDKPVFSGKRIKRGLYRASDGRLINADVQGSYNMIKKVAPKAFESRVVEDGTAVLASLVVHPVRKVIVPSQNQKEKSKAAL
jgi:putative transposase